MNDTQPSAGCRRLDDAAYHQQITQAFREAATSRGIGYGGRVLDPLGSASDMLDLINILEQVYSQLPLCL